MNRKRKLGRAHKHEIVGIHKHTLWDYEHNGRIITIDHDRGICPGTGAFYLSEGGSGGEGCNTVWFPTLKQERDEVEYLFETGFKVAKGPGFMLCDKCACSYSNNDPRQKGKVEYACYKKKEEYAKRKIIIPT